MAGIDFAIPSIGIGEVPEVISRLPDPIVGVILVTGVAVALSLSVSRFYVSAVCATSISERGKRENEALLVTYRYVPELSTVLASSTQSHHEWAAVVEMRSTAVRRVL